MEANQKCEAWNKGKLVGQKPPLKPKDIWAIRIRLQNAHAVRDLALFNLAIDCLVIPTCPRRPEVAGQSLAALVVRAAASLRKLPYDLLSI